MEISGSHHRHMTSHPSYEACNSNACNFSNLVAIIQCELGPHMTRLHNASGYLADTGKEKGTNVINNMLTTRK